MAVTETIQELLQGIDDAQYGREMRQFIHKGIQKCYEEGSAGETDLVAREDIAAAREDIAAAREDIAVLQSSTATVLNSLWISRKLEKGRLVIYDGKLYRATGTFNAGYTLVLGTDLVETTIDDELFKIGTVRQVVITSQTLNANNKWINLGGFDELPNGTYIVSIAATISKTVSGTSYGISAGYSVGGSDRSDGAATILLPGDGSLRKIAHTYILVVTNSEPLYLKCFNGNISCDYDGVIRVMRINNISAYSGSF